MHCLAVLNDPPTADAIQTPVTVQVPLHEEEAIYDDELPAFHEESTIFDEDFTAVFAAEELATADLQLNILGA